MSDAANFTYRAHEGVKLIVVEEPETFLVVARDAGGLPIYNAAGSAVGTFFVKPSAEDDEVPGLTDEDCGDMRDARAAMADVREHGTIPWEQVKAELGL